MQLPCLRSAEHAVPPTSRCRSSPTSPSDGAYRSCFPQHSATQPQRRAAQQLLRSSALDSGSGMPGEEAAAAAAAATDTALEALPAPLSMAVLYKFSRPHTLFGTFISVCSISALALVSTHELHHTRSRLISLMISMFGMALPYLCCKCRQIVHHFLSYLRDVPQLTFPSHTSFMRLLSRAVESRTMGDSSSSGCLSSAGASAANERVHSGP